MTAFYGNLADSGPYPNAAIEKMRMGYRFLCEPSQSGGLPLTLQPQKNTLPDFSAVYFTGVNSVPLCEPSQKGCLLLLPQLHQK